MKPQVQHDDETWLVSYADMITLLLGFFVILFSFSTVDSQKFSKVTGHITDALGKDPNAKELDETVIADKKDAIERQEKALKELSKLLNMGSVAEFVDRFESEKSRPELAAAARDILGQGTGEQSNIMEIIIPDDTLFQRGQTVLNASSLKGLRKVANKIRDLQGNIEVHIAGHTDSSPVQTLKLYPNNWALSSVRASSVAQALMDFGVDPRVLRPVGFADTQPMFPEKTPEGVWNRDNMRRNRRVAITIRFKE